jgi:hypothetical protein
MFYMMAAASASLLIVCVVSGQFAFPQTALGWKGLFVAAALYGFAIIAFFLAISIIGPLRTSLLAYADAAISAGLGFIVLSNRRNCGGHCGIDWCYAKAVKSARC